MLFEDGVAGGGDSAGYSQRGRRQRSAGARGRLSASVVQGARRAAAARHLAAWRLERNRHPQRRPAQTARQAINFNSVTNRNWFAFESGSSTIAVAVFTEPYWCVLFGLCCAVLQWLRTTERFYRSTRSPVPKWALIYASPTTASRHPSVVASSSTSIVRTLKIPNQHLFPPSFRSLFLFFSTNQSNNLNQTHIFVFTTQHYILRISQ